MVSVFTSESAAIPIKCYSPELMVVPSYDITDWQGRLHILIVGPGLGRSCPPDLVKNLLLNNDLPMIIDADGLFQLQNNLDLLSARNSEKKTVILTPNRPEFERLKDAAIRKNLIETWNSDDVDNVMSMSKILKCTVFLKGENDIVGNYDQGYWISDEIGSNRRCGGQENGQNNRLFG